MWKGLYNHVEKSTPPGQSPADFLSDVREQSQQLEEELTNHQEVPAGGTAHHHHYLGSRQGNTQAQTNIFLLQRHHNLNSTSISPKQLWYLNDRLNTTGLPLNEFFFIKFPEIWQNCVRCHPLLFCNNWMTTIVINSRCCQFWSRVPLQQVGVMKECQPTVK